MMKKILLGTSAIVGASVLLASPAWAQAQKPKLEMSGFLRFEAWQIDQDKVIGDVTRGVAFEMDDIEIHSKGSSKADNGLEYGFYVELQETSSSATAYDEGNVFFAGNWGRLELGSQDAVHNNWKMGAYAISADKDGAWDGNNLFYTRSNAAYIGTDFFGGDDSNKISYMTPVFSGFQAGISYMPNSEAEFNSGLGSQAAGTQGVGGNGNMNDQIGIAAIYKGTFSGVGIEATGRYARAEYQGNDLNTTSEKENAEAWGFGAKVSYMGFSVAGSWQDLGDSGITKANKAAGHDAGGWWDIGVAYETGPYKVSVVYMQSEANNGGTGVEDDDVKYLQIGGAYAAAPGLDFYAAYQYVDLDQVGTVSDNTAKIGRAHV